MNMPDEFYIEKVKNFSENFLNNIDLYYFGENFIQIASRFEEMINKGKMDLVKQIETDYVNPRMLEYIHSRCPDSETILRFAKRASRYYPYRGDDTRVEYYCFSEMSLIAERITKLDKWFTWYDFNSIKHRLKRLITKNDYDLFKPIIKLASSLLLNHLESFAYAINGLETYRLEGGPKGRSEEFETVNKTYGVDHQAEGFYLLVDEALKKNDKDRIHDLYLKSVEVIGHPFNMIPTEIGRNFYYTAHDLAYEYLEEDLTTRTMILNHLILNKPEGLSKEEVIYAYDAGFTYLWTKRSDANAKFYFYIESLIELKGDDIDDITQEYPQVRQLLKDILEITDYVDGNVTPLMYEDKMKSIIDNYLKLTVQLPHGLYSLIDKNVMTFMKKQLELEDKRKHPNPVLALSKITKDVIMFRDTYGKARKIYLSTNSNSTAAGYIKWLESRYNNTGISEYEYFASYYALKIFGLV